MKRFKRCWSSVLVCCLGLATFTAALNNIQDVLVELFGKAASNDETRKALQTHLETLLALGTKKPGDKLQYIPEYTDPIARHLGMNISRSLETRNIYDWINDVGELLPKLDETKSFALVRRLLVAALLKYWLEHQNNIPDGCAVKIEDVLLKLYNQHRIGAVHKGIMEYLHVSKSGGTSWCHVAELNNCTTERYDRAYVCQIRKFDDRVRWLNMTFHMLQVPVYQVPKYVLRRFSHFGNFRKDPEIASCRSRRHLVITRGYNYYSNEYTVHGGHRRIDNAHMCSSFFNVVIVRDPLKRLISHLKFVMWSMSGERGYNDTLLFNHMYANRTSHFWQALGPAIVDNYFVRSLLGERAFHLPVGAVTQDMLSAAELVLAQFDLVLVLEQEMDLKALITTYGVGWKHTLSEVHDKDSNIREAEFNTTGYIPKDVDRLLKAQTIDVELYEFSKTLVMLDPVVYAVARKAGVQPLPPLTGTQLDYSPCGLLRRQDKEALLAALGAKAVTAGLWTDPGARGVPKSP